MNNERGKGRLQNCVGCKHCKLDFQQQRVICEYHKRVLDVLGNFNYLRNEGCVYWKSLYNK